ncbi:MAG: histidinol-phosphatase [Muribaculaceae bacterium]|nr:histidinol-phosphatase [Muribaculaceae bacterium]
MKFTEQKVIDLPETEIYNYHSHTQYCDGRAPMVDMAAAALEEGMEIWGFSPHSPVTVESKCNMSREDVPLYIDEAARIKEKYTGRMKILTGMEIDFLSPDFGPHIDYFQNLPLDYMIGSVHFVPNQDGIPLDCDGRFERFSSYLKDGYDGDLRYVVEKYFEQVLIMIERGGFDILGHLDKIAGNATLADPSLEDQGWYNALVDDVIRNAKDKELIIEINTKSFLDKHRFFPSRRYWPLLIDRSKGETPEALLHKNILFNSDTHYPEKVNLGRMEAIDIFKQNVAYLQK